MTVDRLLAIVRDVVVIVAGTVYLHHATTWF